MATRDKLKYIGIGILLTVLVMANVAASSQRERLFKKSGPKMHEAIVLLIVDQFNLVRQNPTTVYPEINPANIMDAIEAKMATLDDSYLRAEDLGD